MDNVNRVRDLSMGWLFCSNFQRFIALGERCIVVLVLTLRVLFLKFKMAPIETPAFALATAGKPQK